MKSMREEVQEIVNFTMQNDPQLRETYWLPDDNDIILIDVVDGLYPAYEVLPFRMSPNEGSSYCQIFITLSPEEFEAVKNNELSLPEKWGKDAVSRLEKVYDREELYKEIGYRK